VSFYVRGAVVRGLRGRRLGDIVHGRSVVPDAESAMECGTF
jgi:hypothetical protein